jgi:hypothetical protein
MRRGGAKRDYETRLERHAIYSHLYSFALSFLFLYVHCKGKGRESNRKPYPFPMVSEIHTETLSLRTLKIMPRNLNEIVSS